MEVSTKAKIRIEFNGKTYRVGGTYGCSSKRECDLFERGVCDSQECVVRLPCDAIVDAFHAVGCSCPRFCFKKVVK